MPEVRESCCFDLSYYLSLLENIYPSFREQPLPSLCGSERTANHVACPPAMGLAPERHMTQPANQSPSWRFFFFFFFFRWLVRKWVLSWRSMGQALWRDQCRTTAELRDGGKELNITQVLNPAAPEARPTFSAI